MSESFRAELTFILKYKLASTPEVKF